MNKYNLHDMISGIYLQTNGYNVADREAILYRGMSDVAKNHGISIHRKWHLEFSADQIPNYDQIVALTGKTRTESYILTDLTTLPGTSDQAAFLAVPVVGKDGTFYRSCGYEINASYFMSYHAQHTRIPYLTCMLTAQD